MNLTALGFFITALLALGGFHLALWWGNEPQSQGWHIWPDLAEMIRLGDFSEPISNIGLVMFPSFVVLALVSPFLTGVLRKSRLTWWLLVMFSGGCLIAVGSFAVLMSVSEDPDPRGPGFYCLMAALMLNFLGMLFVRQIAMARSPGGFDESEPLVEED